MLLFISSKIAMTAVVLFILFEITSYFKVVRVRNGRVPTGSSSVDGL